MITNDIQTIAKNLGNSGCYFLSLCSVAEEVTGEAVNVLECAVNSLDRGYITPEFYVNYPGLILEMLTGKKWNVSHGEYPRKAMPNEYLITRYEWKKTMNTIAHFERENFEPIADCPTSLYGRPVSVRICKVLK